MTDLPLSSDLRSQIVTSALEEREEYCSARKSLGFNSGFVFGNLGAGSFEFYKQLAKKLNIDSYAKCFGNVTMTETWKRLVHYEGEFPPPESIERTERKAKLPNESPHIALKKATVMEEYLGNSDKAQINMVTDITPQSILQLPILPLSSLHFLPPSRGLFFVMVSKTEPKVIYVGKSQNLKVSWEPVYTRSRCPIAGHRKR
ncbi:MULTISPECIES: hypothetical protein [unclassified Microcoleus]|uniref:hypothetical protein n=1 Tax=unclassified Microcoleus TaxID=2642155 RepID=UPI002FCFA79F